jgi:hypothetical protein
MFITHHYVTQLHAWTESEKLKSSHITITKHHVPFLPHPLNCTRASAIQPSKPSCHYMFHQVKHSQILRSAQTVYLFVLYGSKNKQQLFLYTALNGWFL